MNKTYKVIYNRTRCMYQVVSELAKGHTKSETPEMLKSLFGKHSGLTRGIVMAVLSMSLAMPVGVAVQAADTTGTSGNTTSTSDTTTSNTSDTTTTAADTNLSNLTDMGKGVITTEATAIVNTAINSKVGSLDANGNYIQKDASVSSNLFTLDTQVKSNADKIGTLDANGNYIQKDASVSSNLSTLDTQVKTNADAINTNKNSITSLKNLSNVSDAGKTVIKEQAKQAVKVAAGDRVAVTPSGSETGDGTITYTVTAKNDGVISNGDTNLVSGGTMYTELRPASTGTYYYISNANTTAANLIALDAALNKAIVAMDIDMSDSTTYTSKLSKYFKVNPKVTTSDDGKTKTYAPDAAANGTNSVAIGPSAQAGEKSTDTTTSTTTATGGTSSTAIGDSAKANGNTSVALGANAQVLNTTDQDGKTTATIADSTAIGSSAKVNGATGATAIGTSAQVNETATGGIAFGKGAVTGEDKGTVTVGDVTANVTAVGGQNSVALGTDAKASGNTSLALGNGAQVNNYTTQSGTTVTKTVNSGSTAIGSGAVVTGANDAVALGSGASVTGTGTNSDDSLAIGKSASVATAKDAMAFGTSASVASGADNAIALGNTAKANTSNTTAIGYNASATGAGAVAIGENTSTSTEGGISIGSGTSVSGRSIAIGYSSDGVTTGSDNTDAVAIGNGAQAYANDSISIGHQAGKGTNEGRTSGYGSLIAIGTNAGGNVKGMQNVALGSGAGSNVKSSYNVAIGSNAGSGINYAAAADSNPQDGYNISIGYEANYQSADANAKNIKESIAIGHSANAVSEAMALGTGATASGDKSMALGYNATAADTDSIALGDKASAAGGNIAIGSGSQAPVVASYDKGYLTGSTSVNGYISVGGTTSATGTTVLRRISNVADGAADQDAVTVAQLKQAYTNLAGTIKTTDNKISDTYTQKTIDSKISTVESKITASQTKYFSINPSSDTLTANVNNDGASTTGAADAMAIGPNATATSAKAVAIGNNVSASGKGSIALGTADNPATSTTVTTGGNTSANPHVTSAEGANSVAIGTSAIAQTDNSVALGTRASVYTSNVTDPATNTTVKVGQQSIAIGYEAETRNSNATSLGSGAKAYSNGSTAIGHSAYAQGADSVVIGTSSTANGASSGIVGKSNTINGSNTYAVGSENNVNGNWGAVTYSGLYGSKNIVTPVADRSDSTKHAMDSLSITGNSNTVSQGSYSDAVQNISILGNNNSITGANTDEANAGTTANITVIGGSNTVTGRDGAGSDDMGKTWNQLTRTTVIGYGNKVNQAAATTSLADTQILGNDVTATLGNSVYLGTGSAAKNANLADATTLTDAEQAAVDALNTTGMTDTEKATAQANAKAAARYATNLKAMKASGTTAGLQTLNTDTTYDDGTSYTYAGSSPTGVVTVGSAGSERRLQNVAAGLVSASSTDAVNGSQLYALTRQLRFGGDNSSFGTTTADDKNVVARGSNEALSIIGGETDTTNLTDNNIGVVADSTNNTLTVKLSKNVNLGSDGSVVTGNTTLANTGLTITGGPKFTSSGIDTASQKITSVKAGEVDTDAANYGQVKAAAAAATTEVKAGANASLGTVETNATDKHKIYTVNVDNLAVKANGTGNTTVALAKGINFVNGTNTTAAVDSNGTVTISATHNKLSTVSAAPTGTKDDVTLTLTDADGNTVTSTGLKNTYTTVTKNGTAHTVTFARNDGTSETLSLGDLDGASTGELATAAAKATSEVTNGTNVASVTTSTGNNGQNIYTVNVDDLAVKTTSGEKKSVHLADGLVFADGDNTTATVGDNGTIKYNVSNDAIKKQAVQAVNVTGGSNVTVKPEANADGTLKTFTISATHNALKSATLTKGANDVSTLTITGNDGDSASVDIKNTHLTVSKDSTAKTVTFTSNDGTTPATTLSLSDFGAASTTDMTAAVAKATTEVKAGTNASLGTVETDTTDQHKIYTVNVDNLGVSQNGTKVGTGVSLKNGLNFTDGTNTTASVAENGTVSYSVSNDAIKAQAKDAVIVAAGDNVSIDAPADVNNVKTYTVKVNDLKLQANGEDKGTRKLAEGINFANGKNTTATVENGKVIYSLNDTLTDLNSMTAKDTAGNQTLVSGSGVTITPAAAGTQPISLTTNGLSMGNQQITHVQSGGDTDTNAANISDVKRLVQASASGTTETGFNVKGDDAAAKKVKLGKQLNVVGGTTDSTKLSDNNIGVVTAADADGNATLTVKLNKAIALDSVTAGNSTLDTNGLTITDGPKFTKSGIDAGSQKITGVANGENPTDAVNKGQLEALQTQVSGGWNLSGKNSDGTAVTAKIGAGKTVTYDNGNYTKAVVTKDDNNNATVKVDVTTGTFGSGTGDKAGTVTATADGLATTQDVANAINSASINVVADNTSNNAMLVKAGDTIHFAKDGNLTLTQDGTKFTYGLNNEISISKVTTSDTTKGSTVQTAEGVATTDAAGNTYIQNGQGITLTPKTPEAGKTAVILSNKGLNNGGNVISGVGAGSADTDAVNVSQLKKVQDQVGSGWQIAGNDGTKVADIGAGKKVAFKSNSRYLMTSTAAAASGETDTGADVTYSLKTKELASGTNGAVASVSDADDGLVTAKNVAETINQTYWTAASGKSGSGIQTDETANAADKQISAGDTVTFNAGNNLSLVQNGASFTYGLQTDLTGMNTIRFGGTLNNGSWSGGLLIGNQAGSGANTAEGNYITGLSNTKWDRAKISENSNMAATEGQLKQAIENITTSGGGTGGFGLQADTGDSIMQDLRKTIQIKGDGEGTQEGNIKTSAENGELRIRLNKKLDLSKDGEVKVGFTKVSNGTIQLGEDTSENKILMDSAKGTAAIGGVTINGANKTLSGLSNTTWETAKATQDVSVGGYRGSTKAATESQLAAAISTATTTAAQNEQHIQAGSYNVGQGKDLDGKAIGKNSVAINVISGDGTKPGDVKGQVVINNVAKADELGDVGAIAKDIRNKNGDATKPTSVVEAINNLNDKVGDKNYSKVQGKEIADGDSATTAIGKLNNRMNDIYQTAGQHTTVSNTDKNLDIKPTTDDKGKTNYEINLSKQVNLGDVKIDGDKGSIEAKSIKSDSFTAGDTVINKDGVKVGDKSALTGDSLKVNGKTYISSDGLNANSQKITNVQTGTADTDAANVGQMREADAKLYDAIQQTDAGLNEVGRAVNKLGNRLNRVGAGAAALAALHPGTYDPNDKWDFSAGVGHYHDANAVAIGAYYHPNDTTILSIGGSMGGGENMVNAGITWKMGRSGREQAAQPVVVRKVEAAPVVQQAAPVRTAPVVTPAPVVAPVPAKTAAPATPVHALPAVTTPMTQVTTGDTAALAQILARQTAILEKLAQNQSQAAPSAAVAHGDDIFPDVPDNHWAYAYVAKLEKAGALKGFKRPAVLKSPMMTRDDFASVLYTAMANGATTNPALNGDDSLNRLAQEFKAELKNVKA